MENAVKFPDNGAIMLISPPLSGAKEIAFSYAAQALSRAGALVFVTTDEPADGIKLRLAETNPDFGGRARFIDAYSPLADEKTGSSGDVTRVSSPLALNELSVAVSQAEKAFVEKGKAPSLVFNSLSTILMYSSPEAVGRFVQLSVAKVKKRGGSALFLLEHGMHDEKTVVLLQHLMDAVIEARIEKDHLIVKARGMPGYEDWTRL